MSTLRKLPTRAAGRPGGPRRSRGAMLWMRAMVVVAVATALPLGLLSEAQAYTVYRSGSPGSATVPFTDGYSNWTGSYLHFGSRSVYRSTSYATSTQRICVDYKVWDASMGSGSANQWEFLTDRKFCRDVAPGYSWTAPAWDMSTTLNFGYSVTAVITWSLTNGYQFGKKVYDYDQAADYRCTTQGCGTGGNAAVGGYLFFSLTAGS
jgi:hypothetical protein